MQNKLSVFENIVIGIICVVTIFAIGFEIFIFLQAQTAINSRNNDPPISINRKPLDPSKFDFVRYIPDDPMHGQALLSQAWIDCVNAEKNPKVKNCLIQEEGAHFWLFSFLELKNGHNISWSGTTTGEGTVWECVWKQKDRCEIHSN